MEVRCETQGSSPKRGTQQWISLTLGMSAWEDLLRTEARIRKNVRHAQREKRRKFVEIVAWTVLISIGGAVLFASLCC